MLLISVCRYRLHEEEFVRPVKELVERFDDVEVVRIRESTESEVSGSESLKGNSKDKAVICGTALKDFDYLNFDFSPLLNFRCLLGICAGYQILAKLFSAELSALKKIGVYGVKAVKQNPLFKSDFRAYFLHRLALKADSVPQEFEVLATQDEEVAAFRVADREFYGVSFHPEVLNPEIIENFAKLRVR